jgi:hypothetical protein
VIIDVVRIACTAATTTTTIILWLWNKKATDIYDGEVEDMSVHEPGSDTSVSEAEIRLRFIQFCWYTSLTMSRRENIRSNTQHKTSKLSPQ